MKMASWWYGNIKWQVDEMASSSNGKFIKWQVDKLKVDIKQVNMTESWQKASWQNGNIRKDCFQVKSNLLTVDNLVFHF